MSTVILFYTIAVGALFMLWFILSRWANRQGQSAEVQRLRLKGEELLAQNAALPTSEATMEVERLLVQNALVITAPAPGEVPPPLLRELPAWPRGLLERHQTIVVPEASLELSWGLLARAPDHKLRIGRAQETGDDVLIEISSGMVIVGRDVFPSLAHLLVFELQ